MKRIIKIGMDVHSTNFTLCAMEPTIGAEERVYGAVQVAPDYKEVLRFIESVKMKLGRVGPHAYPCPDRGNRRLQTFCQREYLCGIPGTGPGKSERESSWHIKGGYITWTRFDRTKGLCKGAIGYKSKALRARQSGQAADVIEYADMANIRFRSKFYRMIRHGKKRPM